MNYRFSNNDIALEQLSLAIDWMTLNSTLTAFGQPPGAFSLIPSSF